MAEEHQTKNSDPSYEDHRNLVKCYTCKAFGNRIISANNVYFLYILYAGQFQYFTEILLIHRLICMHMNTYMHMVIFIAKLVYNVFSMTVTCALKLTTLLLVIRHK